MDEITAIQNTAEKDARLFHLELFIAKFLRYGVLLAGLLMFIGWMMQIDLHHNAFVGFETYHHIPLMTTLQSIVTHHAWGRLMGYMGLIALIMLPIARVALVAMVFMFERDFILAFCALLVLFGLGFSFVLGFEI